MNAFSDAGPAAKKPRTDTANDEAEWGDFDLTIDDLAIVDSLSQAHSQRPRSSTKASASGGYTFQRHHSWTASPNENLLPNITKSRSESIQPDRTANGFKGNQTSATFKNRFQINDSANKPEVKSWNGDIAFGAQKLSGASLQEVERQKQELKRLQDEKIRYEEQIKQLNDSLSRKDLEIQAVHNEVDLLKQQLVIKEKRQQEHEQEIAKLKTELEFKQQELTSEQWNVSQQQHIRSNNDNNSNKRLHFGSSSQSRQKSFKSPLKVTDDTNGFPSQSTFSKRIALKTSEGASENSRKSATIPCSTEICQNLNDSVLQLKRPLGIETGPALVDFLLQQTEIIQPFSGTVLSQEINKNSTHVGHGGLTTQGQSPKSRLGISAANSSQEVQCDPSSVDIITGISRLLEDDGAIVVNRDVRVPLVLPELNIFKICLGMRLDCAKSLLPSIDKALSSSLSVSNSVPVISEPAMQSSASTHCSQSATNKQCSFTTATLNKSVQTAISTLRILKQLVYCSQSVCHCLIHEKAGIVRTRSENAYDNNNPLPGTSFAHVVQDLDYDKKHSFHPIVQKLFKLCCQPLQLEQKSSMDASLLQLTLEILKTVATYCPFDELPRFLPLITPLMLQNCSSLVLDGSVFVELISLLTILCSNPNIVEASCSQDDGCFWISISSVWQAARKELSCRVMRKLDNLMIQLLSICLIHDGVKPPFLSTDELHCQFEVISGIVLCLHSQLMLYDESPNLLSVPMLRNGVSLLHQVATRDVDFRHHRAQVNFEMFAFLHWLARVKTGLKIGPGADLLLEMWSIKEYESCEGMEEDFPWTT